MVLQLKELFNAPVHFEGNLAVVKQTSGFENQTQTNDSFSEKWVTLDKESRTEASESFQKDWLLQLYGFGSVEGLKSFLADKQVIIDAGCGIGYKTAWLAGLAPHAIVFGVDFSEAVNVAARRYAHIKNAYFLRADIADMPFKPGALDFILCDQVIHHTEDPEKSFAHMASLLSAAGKFA